LNLMPDVIALGELLIDFVPTVSGVTLLEAAAFAKAPGGAPANVGAGLARLGVSTGFMGKVGDDAFGHFVAETLQRVGVDTTHLLFSREARTALAFVSLRSDGEREFMFYRHPSADMLYRPEEVDLAYVRSAKAFHFGSISLIDEPSRSATFLAAETARDAGLLVSYDPNLRLALWESDAAARAGIMLGWKMADVIKISEEELAFLCGAQVVHPRLLSLWRHNLRLLVVTRGAAGCSYATPDFSGDVCGFSVKAVDTTGAGDGFVAGMLKGLLEAREAHREERKLREICRYANAVGALTTTGRGAIPAMPTADQVVRFLVKTQGL